MVMGRLRQPRCGTPMVVGSVEFLWSFGEGLDGDFGRVVNWFPASPESEAKLARWSDVFQSEPPTPAADSSGS